MKILSIGDIHGKTCWKELVRDRINEFDKAVFIGDYVDAFDVSNDVMLQNLRDIIEFKKAYANKVVLLLGNHDIQYILKDRRYSGFRSEMMFDFGQLFKNNIKLFDIAFTKKSKDGHQYLWTHAGVSSKWLNIAKDLLCEFARGEAPEDDPFEVMKFSWLNGIQNLFSAGNHAYGDSPVAGPVWIRPNSLNENPLPGVTQIVGHTRFHEITRKQMAWDNSEHIFIDVLDEYVKQSKRSSDLIVPTLELEIE